MKTPADSTWDGNPSTVHRLSDAFSPHAFSAIQSFVPNMMSKAAWYAVPSSLYASNAMKVAAPLQCKEYATS